MNDFKTTITVEQSPAAAFRAINDVRGWWSRRIDGPTDTLGGAFVYRFHKDHFTKQTVTELVPNEKVVWHVSDCRMTFAGKENEWTGTDVVFEIREKAGATEVSLTHVGLVPECACYDACREGWTFYVEESLRQLIAAGQGAPDRKSRA